MTQQKTEVLNIVTRNYNKFLAMEIDFFKTKLQKAKIGENQKKVIKNRNQFNREDET